MPVKLFPLVGSGPGAIALFRKEKSRRRKSKYVQNQCFTVSSPSVLDESSFWLPAVGNCQTAIECPMPICRRVESICQLWISRSSFKLRLPIGSQGHGRVFAAYAMLPKMRERRSLRRQVTEELNAAAHAFLMIFRT